MAKKRISRKSKIGSSWSDSDSNRSVVYGKLIPPPGAPPKTKPLFEYVGEKIPFEALDWVKEKK